MYDGLRVLYRYFTNILYKYLYSRLPCNIALYLMNEIYFDAYHYKLYFHIMKPGKLYIVQEYCIHLYKTL